MSRRRHSMTALAIAGAVLASVPVAAAPSAPTAASSPSTVSSTPSTAAKPQSLAPRGQAEQPILPPVNNVIPVTPSGKIVAVGKKSGLATKVVQDWLVKLGFWNMATGKYDWSTQQAVMAFQKYVGIKRTGSVNSETAKRLGEMRERARGFSNKYTLVEIDKGRQLLFIVINGQTMWTFNTSTGTGKTYTATSKLDPTKDMSGVSITPSGYFRTNRQRKDGWWEGDLGQIYRPKYFNGGIAIHGMTNVPSYPASHGCVRVSLPAMDFIWANKLVPLGTPVWVHD